MRLVAVFLAICTFAVRAVGQAPAYFLWDGRQLTPAYNDPAEANVTEWRIWLFKKNQEQRTGQQWGAISADTLSAVQDKLLKAQKFEDRYERWCKCDYGSATHKNPSAPIAVTEPARASRAASAMKDLRDRLESVHDAYEAFAAARDMASEASAPSLPSLGEFMSKLKDAHETAAEIDHTLSSATASALTSVGDQLDRLTHQIESSHDAYQRAKRAALPPSLGWASHRTKFTEQTVEFIAGGVIIHNIVANADKPPMEWHKTIRFDQIGQIALTRDGLVIRAKPDAPCKLLRMNVPGLDDGADDCLGADLQLDDREQLRAAYLYFEEHAPSAKAMLCETGWC